MSESAPTEPSSSTGVQVDSPFAMGLLVYLTTILLMLFGAAIGTVLLPEEPHPLLPGLSDQNILARLDGVWYAAIAQDGYQYSPTSGSRVAFFPLYPALGAALARVTGLRADLALVLWSQVALVASLVLFQQYVSERGDASGLALAAMAIWPTTFFFRMAYAESTFLLLALAAMYGMRRGWPPIATAVCCGLAAAARPVGVALLLPFALHLWRRAGGVARFVRSAAWLMPLACWGLFAYMAYLHFAFGDALAFSRTQRHWAVVGEADWSTYLRALLTLQPLRSVYDPSAEAYWSNFGKPDEPLLSLQFANPIWFSLCVLLLVIGWRLRWLDEGELLLGAALLLIPYVTHSYQTAFTAQGRYAAVVFPAYIVLAQLAARLPTAIVLPIGAVLGALFSTYTALFVACYRMI